MRGNKPGASQDWRLQLPVIQIILLKEYHQNAANASLIYLKCPECGFSIKYHGHYWKWLYFIRILIRRVKCQNPVCGKTHALIPADSAPGASTGTKEHDQFIKMRQQGCTVEEAGQCFVDAGMNPDYPEELHKRFQRYQERIKAVFLPKFLSENYWDLVIHLALDKSKPVSSLNLQCYSQRCNPVLFSRKDILFFRNDIPNNQFTHNIPCSLPP